MSTDKHDWFHSRTWTLTSPNGLTRQLSRYARDPPGDTQDSFAKYNSVQWRLKTGDITRRVYPKTILLFITTMGAFIGMKINHNHCRDLNNYGHKRWDEGYEAGVKSVIGDEFSKIEVHQYLSSIAEIKKKQIRDMISK